MNRGGSESRRQRGFGFPCRTLLARELVFACSNFPLFTGGMRGGRQKKERSSSTLRGFHLNLARMGRCPTPRKGLSPLDPVLARQTAAFQTNSGVAWGGCGHGSFFWRLAARLFSLFATKATWIAAILGEDTKSARGVIAKGRGSPL